MDALRIDPHYPHPKEVCERIIELGERIIAGSTDSEDLREHAAMSLCHTSDELHDTENALKYADMCGSIYSSREGLRAFVTDGEDGVRATQEYLIALIQSAVYTATNIDEQIGHDRRRTIDRSRFRTLTSGSCSFRTGGFGYMANDMSILCIWKAGIYASRKDREKTLSALAEKASVTRSKGRRSAKISELHRAAREPRRIQSEVVFQEL